MRRNAEEQSAKLVDEQEVLKIAKQRSVEMLTVADQKTKELKRAAGEYVDKMMRDAEASLADALETVRKTQAAFRSNASTAPSAPVQTAEPETQGDVENEENWVDKQ